jgi:rubrerythrin
MEKKELLKILLKYKRNTINVEVAMQKILDLYNDNISIYYSKRDLSDPKNKINTCDICGNMYLDQSFEKCPLCEGDKIWYDNFTERLDKIKKQFKM